MNLNPNQPDETTEAIDEALLDDALAQPTPAELEAKILKLTDPQMLSLLDEALAPEAASDALTQRILAATSVQAPNEAPGVLARIGPSTFRYAAAAAIVLAVGIGLWFANQSGDDTNSSIAGNDNTPDIVDEVDDGLATDDADWLTSGIAMSDNLFDDTADPIQGTLDAASDSLDSATISRDNLWSELEAYEQFLSDIEAGDV